MSTTNVTPVQRPMGMTNRTPMAPRMGGMNINVGAPNLGMGMIRTPVAPRLGATNVTPVSGMQFGSINKSESIGVSRGLNIQPVRPSLGGQLRQPNVSNLGQHWTPDKGVAEKFAGINQRPKNAVVVHAQIPKASLETSPSELNRLDVIQGHKGVGGLNEQEVTVKSGAPVNVTGVTRYRGTLGDVKSRTRTYNPPRQMQA